MSMKNIDGKELVCYNFSIARGTGNYNMAQ